MRQLVVKYSLAVILTTIASRIMGAAIGHYWADGFDGVENAGTMMTFSNDFFAKMAVAYLFNLIVLVMIRQDLRKQKLRSIPLLILTILNCAAGAMIFLLISVRNDSKLFKND